MDCNIQWQEKKEITVNLFLQLRKLPCFQGMSKTMQPQLERNGDDCDDDVSVGK